MREVTFTQAQREAFDEELARDPNVFIIGEDIGEHWGGPMGQFQGLFAKYGPERILETPISETAIMGAAIGAAATGMRPIAAMMFVDFLGVAGDELLNQLQMRYMYGGKVRLPITILASIGAGVSAAAQHSKSLFGWLMAIKGLKIVAPSNPYDAKGLLKAAIRDDNPVAYLTHKRLGGRRTAPIPDEEYLVPLGQADIKREGKDVTVVATAFMVSQALAAAETLAAEGISLEVIDPRTLVPLDTETILASVRKTGRLVIISEEPRTGSWAAEVAATVAEEAFDYLDAPIRRVCAPDTPVPFAPVLERFWMPDAERLVATVRQLLQTS